MIEKWLPVVGFPLYEVSNLGQVRRVGGRPLRPRPHPNHGSLRVVLSVSGTRYDCAAHRLMLDAFIGTHTRKLRYRWIDGDFTNTALTNLEPRRGVRCIDCGDPITADNGHRAHSGAAGFRSVCRACAGTRRRSEHDEREDAKRANLPSTCEICGKAETVTRGGKVRRPTMDHCHSTGRQRGVLCSRCNTGVGMFQDDPDLMRAAADYIERYEELVA